MRVSHQPGNTPEVGNSKKSGRSATAGETKRTGRDSGVEREEGVGERATSDVRTEISSKSKEFAHAKAVANEAPDVRAEKIADIKRRIAEKSYQVDAGAVADKLVDEHLRMPGKD